MNLEEQQRPYFDLNDFIHGLSGEPMDEDSLVKRNYSWKDTSFGHCLWGCVMGSENPIKI